MYGPQWNALTTWPHAASTPTVMHESPGLVMNYTHTTVYNKNSGNTNDKGKPVNNEFILTVPMQIPYACGALWCGSKIN